MQFVYDFCHQGAEIDFRLFSLQLGERTTTNLYVLCNKLTFDFHKCSGINELCSVRSDTPSLQDYPTQYSVRLADRSSWSIRS